MAWFYADENFPLPVVETLRRLGHDVITVAKTGKSGQSWPDISVLEFAEHDNRAVLTFNRKHFIRLHEQHNRHAGIIVCSFDPDFDQLASRIHATGYDAKSLEGQLIRINRL